MKELACKSAPRYVQSRHVSSCLFIHKTMFHSVKLKCTGLKRCVYTPQFAWGVFIDRVNFGSVSKKVMVLSKVSVQLTSMKLKKKTTFRPIHKMICKEAIADTPRLLNSFVVNPLLSHMLRKTDYRQAFHCTMRCLYRTFRHDHSSLHHVGSNGSRHHIARGYAEAA